jgi:cation diffusion facilitator CzcD-associated flavoprotein CzcO
VAVKYDLEKYVKFQTKVDSATWDEESGQWKMRLTASDGTQFDDYGDVLFNCSGVLNTWRYPNIEGLETFKGKLMHSAQWDNTFDLAGKRVAVIGGGSSAVQIIPNIQPKVGKLIAFLRSPVWVTTGFGAKYAGPGGTNFEYSEEQIKEFNADKVGYNQYARDIEGELNKRFNLMHLHSKDQKSSRELISNLMADKLGSEVLSKKMVPQFALGCRRMTPGSGYLESLSKENVQPIHESVLRFTETGVVDESGNEHEVDVVICATGFDTSFTPHFKVYGRNNAEIHDQFGEFPVGYLGITAGNFPNLFREWAEFGLLKS